MNDIELTQAALEACGYRVHLRERAGTRWVTACKGLEVQYRHWHPLTNISQAMQLLIDCRGSLIINYPFITCSARRGGEQALQDPGNNPTPQALINAQCRAIVTACASLKPVR